MPEACKLNPHACRAISTAAAIIKLRMGEQINLYIAKNGYTQSIPSLLN